MVITNIMLKVGGSSCLSRCFCLNAGVSVTYSDEGELCV